MDAFYASVEQRDNPEIRGLPVLVGGKGRRGVVAAASYEARRYGIFSAMPMAQARARCPDAVIVRPRMNIYRDTSAKVFALFRSYTPVVEGLSLDEAFLDVTDSLRLFGAAADIGERIRRDILAQTALTASVGVANSKLVAKIASDHCKPDGLLCVPQQEACKFLAPLPVGRIPGIGPRLVPRLERAGLHTLGDLAEAPAALLDRLFGKNARSIRNRARGIDHREVSPRRDTKSISSEETFETDLTTLEELRSALHPLADRTAARLRAAGLQAGTVSIKARRADFRTFTRQRNLKPATSSTGQIGRTSLALLEKWWFEQNRPRVRLLGVGTGQLSSASQQDLFDLPPRSPGGNPGASRRKAVSATETAVDLAVDDIRARYGDAAIKRARGMPRRNTH
jgi:DNA polymerase-4